jgi:fumarate reductase subunit D
MPKRTAEPFLWLLFSAGGMLAALLIPALLLLFGFAFPLGWLTPPDHEHLLAVLRFPVTRLALLGLCVLAFFHWAHRFRYTLDDGLQLKSQGDIISFFCYGLAGAGSVVAAYLLLIVL